MCTSQAEGGKRCYGHGKKAYEGARARLARLPDNASTKRVAKAEASYETAVDKFAQHLNGFVDLTTRVNAIKAGAPLEGDSVPVMEVALSDHAHLHRICSEDGSERRQVRRDAYIARKAAAATAEPVVPVSEAQRRNEYREQRRAAARLEGDGLVGGVPSWQPSPDVEFAADFAESLRTGNPVAQATHDEDSKPDTAGETALARALRTGERDGDGSLRAPRHRQVTESPLASALRTGDTNLDTDTSDIDDRAGGGIDDPVTIGGITIARGQVPFLRRWGTDPVTVATKMHVQHFKGDGWSEYDLVTESYKPVTDSGSTVGSTGLFAKDTGVLVVQNARTGEKAALRARRDTTTGHWSIHEDVTV